MLAIVQDVIFPIMSYTDADQNLWKSNPIKYIYDKFVVSNYEITPVQAAQSLFDCCSKKRKNMGEDTMPFIMDTIASPDVDPKQKDGALHMFGTLANILLKEKLNREKVEIMLRKYILPELNSIHGHMRARACWVLHRFSEKKI